jgi:hypothetical protein
MSGVSHPKNVRVDKRLLRVVDAGLATSITDKRVACPVRWVPAMILKQDRQRR